MEAFVVPARWAGAQTAAGCFAGSAKCHCAPNPRAKRSSSVGRSAWFLLDRKNDDDVEEEQLVAFNVSRRVFGVVLGSLSVWAGTKLFFQRELDLALDYLDEKLGLVSGQRFYEPMPVDPTTAQVLLNAPLVVAQRMKIISADELKASEERLRPRAQSFFLESPEYEERSSLTRKSIQSLVPDESDIRDSRTLSWLLYVRMHLICERATYRNQRRQLMLEISQYILDHAPRFSLANVPLGPRIDQWTAGIDHILAAFQATGLCSTYKIEFPITQQEEWVDEGRTSVSVFADSIALMPAAQVLAGESFNDLAPIFLGEMLRVYLQRCGIATESEEFYMDDTFQRDFTKYKPTAIAIQLDLALVSNASTPST
ncbi:hypothetical protein FVE85_1337 [Porphyridium purpureum]|uniref:Uncharacterized protein n=1 Tax=Porphyridium purpureum TaxID=35688 RepID=A0A5J4YJ67_PORPP|nr:hypothetical protein FVE85_1337 [Porphyridium purpureum]|eukprot:POR7301..scf251_18